MRCVFRPHYRDYKLNQAKIDDSQGMCGSESDYDTCWSRMCNPSRSTVLRDVLRGLLVLIGLAIVITIIFLLCYFLINDIEKKEEAIVDTLIKDFSSGNRIQPESEFSLNDVNQITPSDLNIYETLPPLRGDLGPDGARLQKGEEEPKLIERLGDQGSFGNIVTDSEMANADGDLANSFVPGKELGEQDFGFIPEIMPEESGMKCKPLRLPLCSGSMPWSMTTFPNFVNNQNLNELQESLKYFQSIIVGSRCSARATEYTCAILEPACGPDTVPLPPCRAFCEDIVTTCSEFFISGNEHNFAFQCSRFPDSKDPSVCVDISRASAVPPITKPSNSQTDPTKANLDTIGGLTNQDIVGIPLEAVMEGREEDNVSQNVPETETPVSNQTSPSEPETGANVSDVLAADVDVTETPVFICDLTKFLCADGSDCLGEKLVCDGVQHCLDNSDEFNCTNKEQSQPEQKPDLSTVLGDMQAETTTQFDIASNANFGIGGEPSSESGKSPKRFSLSDMLSDSALVAVPVSTTTPPPIATRQLRFGLPRSTPNTGKALEISLSPAAAAEEEKNSKQVSLADLLSSSSLKPANPQPLVRGPNGVSANDYDEQLTPASQRSLSALLSSALPSFSSSPSRSSSSTCKELKCLDGTCISMKQIGDGVQDCPDGADERQGNHISVE